MLKKINTDEIVSGGNAQSYEINTTANSHKANIHIIKPLADAMVKCYGPYGKNSIMDPLSAYSKNSIMEKIISRDGVSIFSELRDINGGNGLMGPFKSTITMASANNDTKGGDGTTSTVLFLYALYKYAYYNDINKIPKSIIEKIEKAMKEYAYVPETVEAVIEAAQVSLNNREELVAPIRAAYQEMENLDMDWRKIHIVAVKAKDIKQDKVWIDISNVASTHAAMLYNKNMEDTNIVYSERPISDLATLHNALLIAQYLAKTLMSNGESKLVIACPTIDKNLLEHTSQIVNHLAAQGFQLDFIEFFDPFKPDLDGSNNLAIASNIPTFDPHNLFLVNEDGESNRMSIDDKEKLALWVANIINDTPKVNITLEDDHTNIIVVAERSDAMEKKKTAIIANINAELKETKIDEVRGRLESQLRSLSTHTAIIYIAAATEDQLELYYDMYKDACLQMIHAKKGVVAAGNVGISRVVSTILNNDKELTDDERNALELIRAVAIHLHSILHRLKAIDTKNTLESMHSTIEFAKDVMMASISESRDACYGIDVITGSSSNKILTSAHTELNILKSAIEISSMWLESNQIVWSNEMLATGYKALMHDLGETDPYDNIII